jgi:hypothetical protein
MQTKVRVKRVELMKIVEGRMRKAENEYKRAVEAFPGREQKWRDACIDTTEKSLEAMRRGKIPVGRYDQPGIRFPEKPQKPSEGRELCDLRRMYTTLKIGSEDTVLLSQEDADFYFGPCVL